MQDMVGKVIAYESGEMTESEIIAFFQEMVNSGIIWQLQGTYGRMATSLIEQGLVTYPTMEEK